MGAIDRINLAREPRPSLAEMPRIVQAVRELLAAIGEAHAAGRAPVAGAQDSRADDPVDNRAGRRIAGTGTCTGKEPR